MLRALAAAVVLMAAAPVAVAEETGGFAALQDALSGLFVVVPTDPATGASMMEVVKGVDGAPDEQVLVAFLDAEAAARSAVNSGLADKVEGRLFNAAELIAIAKGDIIWRTSVENASLVNGTQTRPPVFYITGPDGNPLTQPIEGRARVVFYVDAVAADSARVAAQNKLSAAGQPTDLSVIAADLISVLQGISDGQAKDAYIAASPSIIIWAAQWDQGKRLIRDYSTQ